MDIKKIQAALKSFGMEGFPASVRWVNGPGNLLVNYFTGGDERMALLNEKYCVVWDYSVTSRDRESHYLDHKYQLEKEEALPFADWDADRPEEMASLYDELCAAYGRFTAAAPAKARRPPPEAPETAGEPAGGVFTAMEAREAWQRLQALCGGLSASAVEQVLEEEDLQEISLLHAEWILLDGGMAVVRAGNNQSVRVWLYKDYLGSMPIIDDGGTPKVNTIDLLAMMRQRHIAGTVN